MRKGTLTLVCSFSMQLSLSLSRKTTVLPCAAILAAEASGLRIRPPPAARVDRLHGKLGCARRGILWRRAGRVLGAAGGGSRVCWLTIMRGTRAPRVGCGRGYQSGVCSCGWDECLQLSLCARAGTGRVLRFKLFLEVSFSSKDFIHVSEVSKTATFRTATRAHAFLAFLQVGCNR